MALKPTVQIIGHRSDPVAARQHIHTSENIPKQTLPTEHAGTGTLQQVAAMQGCKATPKAVGTAPGAQLFTSV